MRALLPMVPEQVTQVTRPVERGSSPSSPLPLSSQQVKNVVIWADCIVELESLKATDSKINTQINIVWFVETLDNANFCLKFFKIQWKTWSSPTSYWWLLPEHLAGRSHLARITDTIGVKPISGCIWHPRKAYHGEAVSDALLILLTFSLDPVA